MEFKVRDVVIDCYGIKSVINSISGKLYNISPIGRQYGWFHGLKKVRVENIRVKKELRPYNGGIGLPEFEIGEKVEFYTSCCREDYISMGIITEVNTSKHYIGPLTVEVNRYYKIETEEGDKFAHIPERRIWRVVDE